MWGKELLRRLSARLETVSAQRVMGGSHSVAANQLARSRGSPGACGE